MPHQKLVRTASAFLAVVAATLCLFEGQCSSGQQAATATLRAHTNNITSLVLPQMVEPSHPGRNSDALSCPGRLS